MFRRVLTQNKSSMSFVSTASMYSFSVAVFVGAYTLFQIQPLIGKIVTAQFGGASAIWCVCLLFFQIALLGGYTLTYLLHKLPLKIQCASFALIALVSALLLKIPGAASWTAMTENPIFDLLRLLTIHLGVPCLLMSATSGLMQSWYARKYGADPYHLYSISNLGSMSALLLYPLVVEPNFGVNSTIHNWYVIYVLLTVLITLSALVTCTGSSQAAPDALPETPSTAVSTLRKPTFQSFSKWVFLSALGSAILLTYTVYLTQDVAPVPLLWVLPLCVYLLTFIICFAKKGPPDTTRYLYLAPLLWLVDPFVHNWLPVDVSCVLGFIFCACMALHGEIVRSKPDAAFLPTYYLAIALGGVVGSLFINLAAPMMFNFYAEREISIFCILGFCYYQAARNDVQLLDNKWANSLLITLMITACLLRSGLMILANSSNLVARKRNFYGCLSVTRAPDAIDLANGGIIHGSQLTDPEKRRQPTRYYSATSGLALIEHYLRNTLDRVRFGVVGLGTGTIAAYGKTGDEITFYELDKDVEDIARHNFTFLSDSPASVKVIIGDARKKLEQENANSYDLFIVDAFNGDAVPVHLLTKEAIQLYLKHIKPDGALLIHASNKFVNFEPVLANIAQNLNLFCITVDSGYTRYIAISSKPWPKALLVEQPGIKRRIRVSRIDPALGVWTDDYNNLAAAILSNQRQLIKSGDWLNLRREVNLER